MPFTPSIALLGTGTMGIGMAHSILRAGLPLTVWNRHPEKAAPLGDDGATVAASLEEAVRGAQIVITMLFDEDVGRRGDRGGDPRRSTTARCGCRRAPSAGRGSRGWPSSREPHGIPFYDAPVVGTKQPAEDGKLTVLASGPARAARRRRAGVRRDRREDGLARRDRRARERA